MYPQPFAPVRWLIGPPGVTGETNVFPLLQGQTFVAAKGPLWEGTVVQQSTSGLETRLGYWSYPRWLFAVRYEFLRGDPTHDELNILWEFFCNHGGELGYFYYFDPTDHAVVNVPIGVGDGSNRDFRLKRQLRGFSEPVFAVRGIATVYANNVSVPFTLSGGLATLSSAPSAGASVTWSGDFMFKCRFDQPELTAEQRFASLWSQSGLKFKSLKS